METMWSEFIQTSEELYATRALRFREDNKDLWLNAMGLADGMDVLEIGCGPGLFCHRVKSFLPHCVVTGLDRDAGFLRYARAKAGQLDLECSFVQGDALALPFEDNRFDACFSHTVAEHVETAGFLREQLRVLRPGGGVSVLSVRTGQTVASFSFLPVTQEERDLMAKAWSRAGDFDRKHDVGKYEMKEQDYPAALENAGFVNINVQFFSVLNYAPDNAGTSRELALAQIESSRTMALSSMEKALRICPDALTQEETNRLYELIGERINRRVALYKQGQKLWDFESRTVMAVTGSKPQRSIL